MAFGWSAGVQAAGCRALQSLAVNPGNRAKIGGKRGIEAIVRAMGAHGSSAGVQEAGCSALINLADHALNKAAIGAKGGIEAVVRAMAAHESSAEVQEAGCLALAKIVSWESVLRSHFREADAVPLVEKALSEFPNNWMLQMHGRIFLIKVVARSMFAPNFLAPNFIAPVPPAAASSADQGIRLHVAVAIPSA